MPTFNEAAASCPLAGVVTVAGPMSGEGSPIKEPMWLTLIDKKENGLCTFRATWLGVFMGHVRGKADGSTSWRFSND